MGEWIYTIFDAGGMPSNVLEHVACANENEAAIALTILDSPNEVGTIENQIFLRWFFAFSICRHPDIMSTGHRRAKDLARVLAQANVLTKDEFVSTLTQFGVDLDDGAKMYIALSALSTPDLLSQVGEVINLAPTDSRLPQQIAILPKTVNTVFNSLSYYAIEILDAPDGLDFILGDTPFPPTMQTNFILPISAKLALRWTPGTSEKLPDWTRGKATADDVADSNRAQMDNSLKVVLGPSKASLLLTD